MTIVKTYLAADLLASLLLVKITTSISDLFVLLLRSVEAELLGDGRESLIDVIFLLSWLASWLTSLLLLMLRGRASEGLRCFLEKIHFNLVLEVWYEYEL